MTLCKLNKIALLILSELYIGNPYRDICYANLTDATDLRLFFLKKKTLRLYWALLFQLR